MQACITLDLEPDHAGRVPTAYTGWAPERLAELSAVLKRHGVPLTAFVVAGALKDQPEAIAQLREAGVEFHLHSHSHNLKDPDSLEEIRRGKDAFGAVFGRPPLGYRAPEGRISPRGWRDLEHEGFLFDSSIFPSLWPAPRYLRFRPKPFRPAGTGLVELPISTVSPLRLIVSLSWFNLLGWPVYRPILERASLPDPLVFDMHLHDLWRLPSFENLPSFWRGVYSRNAAGGIRLLEAFLDILARRGCTFASLTPVARQCLSAGVPC